MAFPFLDMSRLGSFILCHDSSFNFFILISQDVLHGVMSDMISIIGPAKSPGLLTVHTIQQSVLYRESLSHRGFHTT